MEECKNCQSLSSRLKEAQQALTGRTVSCSACNDMAERLSQAEAENKKYEAFIALEKVQAYRQMMEANEKLRKRLSHLMDVAGKMAGAIDGVLRMYKTKRCPQCETNLRNLEAIHGHPIAPQGLVAHPAHFGCECYLEKEAWQKAKLAIAEWDGIKDGGK